MRRCLATAESQLLSKHAGCLSIFIQRQAGKRCDCLSPAHLGYHCNGTPLHGTDTQCAQHAQALSWEITTHTDTTLQGRSSSLLIWIQPGPCWRSRYCSVSAAESLTFTHMLSKTNTSIPRESIHLNTLLPLQNTSCDFVVVLNYEVL